MQAFILRLPRRRSAIQNHPFPLSILKHSRYGVIVCKGTNFEKVKSYDTESEKLAKSLKIFKSSHT